MGNSLGPLFEPQGQRVKGYEDGIRQPGKDTEPPLLERTSRKAERLFDPNCRGLGQPLGPVVLAFHLEMTLFILLSSAAQLPSWFQGTYAQAHQTPWAKFKIPRRILSLRKSDWTSLFMPSPLVPSPWQLTAEFPTEEQIVFYFPEMPPDIAGQRGSPTGTRKKRQRFQARAVRG